MELKDALNQCFPDEADILFEMAKIRSLSDAGLSDMGLPETETVLEKVGKNVSGINKFSKLMKNGHGIAMEYIGHYGGKPGFTDIYDCYDIRPRMNIAVLCNSDGNPYGMMPFGCENIGSDQVYKKLKGCDCTIVTDRIFYTDANDRGLNASGEEYLLSLTPFPVSYSSTRNAQMQELKHNGKILSACKIRYDRKWLFRFTDRQEAERLRKLIDYEDVHPHNVEFLKLSAGSHDVLSNTGFDIREVRRLLDIRSAMDSKMKRHRKLLGNEIDTLNSENAVMGYMLMSVISMMLC